MRPSFDWLIFRTPCMFDFRRLRGGRERQLPSMGAAAALCLPTQFF